MKRVARLALVSGAIAMAGAGALARLLARTSARITADGQSQPLQKADAILVFGAAVWPEGPSLSLRVRVARAAEVYLEGWAPVIICSGGFSSGVSEAAAMRDLLLERGIPSAALIPDDGGVTTRDALYSARAFGRGRWRRIIAVSSPYHLHRIRQEAERQGLDVVLCAATRSGPLTDELRAFDRRQHRRETLAVLAYAWRPRVERMLGSALLRLPRSAGRQLIGRIRSFAGDVDAVADAIDEVSDIIKSAGQEPSDAEATLTPAAAGLAWPVEGAITSPFGLRYRRLHSGVDVRAAYGHPIRASGAGVVIAARPLGAYGNVVIVDHGSGLSTVYAHQSAIMVSQGAKVSRGQLLGYAGTTGRAKAPHLHFEVRVHGSPVDPVAYLSQPS